jgi:hypothetical protein
MVQRNIQLASGKRRHMKTIGRNEPCPCGSGKKYKFCCGSQSGAPLAKLHMPKLDTVAMLQQAMRHLQAGGLSQAKSLCEQILHIHKKSR